MARPPKPWYRESHKCWYVTINGELHKLGPNEKEAIRQFHELMARSCDAPTLPQRSPLLVEICDRYLDWCEKHRAEKTYQWYKGFIQKFLDHMEGSETLSIAHLRTYHVVEWVDAHPNWTDNGRRGAIIAIQRPLNWAEKMGYIEKNPIGHIEKPQPKRRQGHITPEQWEAIRDHYPDGDVFRTLLTFIWETGCRPQEARILEARHVDLQRLVCVFPPEEAKGKRRYRLIHLNATASGILKEVMRPEGTLFQNAIGRPWTAYAMNCRFCRLKKHMNKKFCTYLLRHGFATRKLTRGVDHLTVAELMGHSDGAMLAKVYQHLSDHHDHLKKALDS